MIPLLGLESFKMKKKRNNLLILAERHVKCESRLLAHVESSGTNSLVERKVLSAVILPRLFHLCDSRAMKEVRVKMGIKEKYDEKKGRNKRKEKKEMRKCEKV